METATYYLHIRPLLSIPNRTKPMRSLTPIRIRLSPDVRFSRSKVEVAKSFLKSVAAFDSRDQMATKSNQSQESMADNMNSLESEKKPPPPPPPEKPEPGDCCGSGCVRCVWDVYYEELEAYNKLYNSDSIVSNSKPS